MKAVMLAYFCCHILGVFSCCINPFLYGFLNPNISSVFNNIFKKVIVLMSTAPKSLINL